MGWIVKGFEADTIRTCDLQIRNLMLYPTELQPLERQKPRRSRGDLGFSRKRPCLLHHPRLRAPGASCAVLYRNRACALIHLQERSGSNPPICLPVICLRSRGDLNPRYLVKVRRFSKPLVSTTHPPLLEILLTVTYNDFLC